jgi:hypothetical protein
LECLTALASSIKRVADDPPDLPDDAEGEHDQHEIDEADRLEAVKVARSVGEKRCGHDTNGTGGQDGRLPECCLRHSEANDQSDHQYQTGLSALARTS